MMWKMVVVMGRMKRTGFTLIELICVLAIMGILMTIAVPSFSQMSRIEKLDISVKGLVNDLRYAKMYAVSRNITSVFVRFSGDVSKGIYTGYKIYYPNNMLQPVLKEVVFYEGIIVDGWSSTFSNVSGENIIEFKNDGSVYPACTIVLKDSLRGEMRYITLTIGYTRIMEVQK
jgi:prepilin-type N-terminal cleavage/methylation domain-containing protein